MAQIYKEPKKEQLFNGLNQEQKEHSLAWEMIKDYKKENIALKILLGLSIIVNVLIEIIK